MKTVTENLNNTSKFWKVIKFMSGTHVASSLPEHILVGSDEIKDKAAPVSQLNKHFICAGSAFDSSNVNVPVPCSVTTATDRNLDLFNLKKLFQLLKFVKL